MSRNLKTPIAIKDYCNLNLDCTHVTTANFMDFTVSKSLELVPKQSIDVYHKQFTRLDAISAPTFGTAHVHNKYFFVPYRTVMPAWNDFIEDVAHTYSNGGISHVARGPIIKNSELVNFLISYECAEEQYLEYEPLPVTLTEEYLKTLDNYDFFVARDFNDGNGPVGMAFNFTPYGRRAFKLLSSLGYGIDFNLLNTEIFHSALPILALARVYIDWYYPSTYVQDSECSTVQSWLTTDAPLHAEYFFDFRNLKTLFDVFDKVCYDADYFVSAWDNPVAPTDGAFSSNISIVDSTHGDAVGVRVSSDNGTPVTVNNVDSSNPGGSQYNKPITQFLLNSLRKLSDYMTRHRLAGARVLDRYLSRFGIVLDSAKLNRSIFISSANSEIRFGDVTNMSGAEGSQLGSYAGKGIGEGDGSFSFTADEYGLLLCISTIVTETSYFQGADTSTMRFGKFDYWTPEFDSLGVQAIGQRELYMPMNCMRQYGLNHDRDIIGGGFDYDTCVFGFTSRYGDYKRKKDLLTGDFRLGSRNTLLTAWNLSRDLSLHYLEDGVLDTPHDANFLFGSDSSQYSRIFYDNENLSEHFKIYHIFKIQSRFPGKPLFDSYEFENENESDKVNIEIGGVKAN